MSALKELFTNNNPTNSLKECWWVAWRWDVPCLEEGQQGHAGVEHRQDPRYWANLGAEQRLLSATQLLFLSAPRCALDAAQNPQAGSSSPEVLESASCCLAVHNNDLKWGVLISRSNDQQTKPNHPVAGRSCPYFTGLMVLWNGFKWWLKTAVIDWLIDFGGSDVFCMCFCLFAEPKNMHEDDARLTWFSSERLPCWRLGWDVGFAPKSVKLSPSLWACWLVFPSKRTVKRTCLHQIQVQLCPYMKH